MFAILYGIVKASYTGFIEITTRGDHECGFGLFKGFYSPNSKKMHVGR